MEGKKLQPVNFAVFVGQITNERRNLHFCSGDALDKFTRGKFAAVLVNVGSHPVEQGIKFAMGNFIGNLGVLFNGFVVELYREEIAKRIGGEVANQAG